MKPFLAELRYLSELYHSLQAEFTGLAGKSQAGNVAALIDTTLRNRELLGRIEQMNARIAQLSSEWDIFSGHLDPSTRKEILDLAESVRHHGTQLLLLCNALLEHLEARRGTLERQLDQLRQGSRYLQSVKPLRNNYPKFVDSLG